MKVIVASMPKAGTKSLEQALTVLGYNVDGFMDQFQRHMNEWDQILTSGFSKEQFQAMYADVDAVTGSPAFGMWQEISEAFPEAKVVNLCGIYPFQAADLVESLDRSTLP